MTFWLYMLKCADDSFYIGHTDDLENRLAQHAAGYGNAYTAKRLPVQLAFCEEFVSREEAITRERQLKGWSRKKKEALCRGDWAEISRLARSRNFGTKQEPV